MHKLICFNFQLDGLKKDLESLRTLLFKSVKLLDHLWAEHLSCGPTSADRLTRQVVYFRNLRLHMTKMFCWQHSRKEITR